MSNPLKRVALSAAALLTVGALVAPQPAGASFNGSTGRLTASTNDGIHFENSTDFLIPQQGGWYWNSSPASYARWSPDGSRATYIDTAGGVGSVRYNNMSDIVFQWGLPSIAGFTRSDPTYLNGGRTIAWSERKYPVDGSHWLIKSTASSPYWSIRTITPDDGADYTHPDGGGPNGALAYQRQIDGGTPEVWLWDGHGLDAADFHKVIDGAEPALSPDGTQVAYISGGHLWKADITGADPVQLTFDDPPATSPTWSADSLTIAYGGGPMVRKIPAAGGQWYESDNLTGRPAYQSSVKNAVTRLAGASRWETATATSQYLWKTAADGTDPRQSADAVVLSRSDEFADALGGAALAAAKQGPLLLTPPTALYPATKAEIQRVLGGDTTKTVYLLGSTGALSANVETAIRALGYQVKRLSGANRYATSLAIADQIDPDPGLILAATGADFPDALAAGAAAGSYNPPGNDISAVVVLTAGRNLTADTKSYLDKHKTTADLYAIGGDAARATAAYKPVGLVGANRYKTAALVATVFFGGQTYAGIATGVDWPDALAGGSLLAVLNGPLLLTGPVGNLNPDTAAQLSANSASVATALAFGGSSIVPNAQLNQAGNWISGPAGFANVAPTPSATSGLTAASITALQGSAEHRTRDQLREAAGNLR